MNLLSMSLFQVATIDDYGGISTCKMHDLIHDLAQLVVGKEYAIVEGKERTLETEHVICHLILRYILQRHHLPTS